MFALIIVFRHFCRFTFESSEIVSMQTKIYCVTTNALLCVLQMSTKFAIRALLRTSDWKSTTWQCLSYLDLFFLFLPLIFAPFGGAWYLLFLPSLSSYLFFSHLFPSLFLFHRLFFSRSLAYCRHYLSLSSFTSVFFKWLLNISGRRNIFYAF